MRINYHEWPNCVAAKTFLGRANGAQQLDSIFWNIHFFKGLPQGSAEEALV
jgi:hypothetical protein